MSRSEKEIMRDAGSPWDRHDATEIASQGPERKSSRRDKFQGRKSSRESKKLHKDIERRRTYSFSPGRTDNIAIRDSDRPPVPPLPANIKGQGPIGSSIQPPEGTQDWQRVPTLHKRSAQDLNRRKSSKRKKEEHDRAAEIKAMAFMIPTRPAPDAELAGRPMKRESQRVSGGLNRRSSDISFPLASSIHSSLSGTEEQTSYKVSAFDVLAPRPTIRYSGSHQYSPPNTRWADISESKKRRVSERFSIPEEALKANKRIDDLADDLDAGDLRELMERDQRRREKKKIGDRIKAEQRLARRQEKQRAEETTATRNGKPPPANMERGVMGRDVVGLGIGTSAVVTSTKRKGSMTSDSGRTKRPTDAFRQDTQDTTTSNPFDDFHRSPSLRTDEMSLDSERAEPVIELAKVGTVAKAQVSPPSSPLGRGHQRGASSISQMVDLAQSSTPFTHGPTKPFTAEPTYERKSENGRKMSENGSSTKAPRSWTAFFKRSDKNRRVSIPSSFSTTSPASTRESIQNALQPAFGYTPLIKSTSNPPKRTMSKFREDLPELPISPPDSRVQSPEADVVPPIRTDYPEKRTSNRASAEDSRVRYDTPTSGYRSTEATKLRDETTTSDHRTEEVPSPEPQAFLSQSLASIDSEGSWLSGRKGGSKRGSAQIQSQQLRDSGSSRYNREFSESAEELGIAEDEYFSRLTPGPEEEYKIHNRRSNTVPSSDDEEGGSIVSPVGSSSEKTKWGAVARTPTVVHRETRAKSREGLLNEFDDYDSDQRSETPEEPRPKSYSFNPDLIEDGNSGVRRATSIDLGKNHVRHISAGSARLLDLKPRASGESKRMTVV